MANIVEIITKFKTLGEGKLTKVQQTLQSIRTKITGINSKIIKPKVDGSGVKKLNTSLGGLQSTIIGLGIGTALVSMAKSIYDIGTASEVTKVKFETFLHSKEKANKLIMDIKKMASQTPLTSKDLEQNSTTLLSFGINAKKVLPILSALGDVSGGDSEKLKSLTLAFGQTATAGKLMGQDLNQMIGQGFNPLGELAKMSGKSMGELKDLMSKGAISSKMVEDAFISATSKGGSHFGLMAKMSKTLGGRVSTLGDKFQVLAVKIYKKVAPALMRIVEVITVVADKFIKLGQWFIKNQDFIMPFVVAIGTATIAFGAFIAITKLGSIAMAIFNAVISANPIGLIVLGVVSLGAAMVYLYNKVEPVNKLFNGMWAGLKAGFNNTKIEFQNYIIFFDNLINGYVLPFVKLMGNVAIGDFGAAKMNLSEMVNFENKPFKEFGESAYDAFKKGYKDTRKKDKDGNVVQPDVKEKDYKGDYVIPGSGSGSGTDSGSGDGSGSKSATGASNSNKNIVINIETLGDFTNMNINNVDDIDGFMNSLRQSLATVVNTT